MNHTKHRESKTERARLRRLERLYDALEGSTTKYITPVSVFDGQIDRNELYLYLHTLEEEGLVRFDGSVAGQVGLTLNGAAFVEEIRRRRTDRGARRRELRRRLLQWIDANYSMSDLIAPSAMLSDDLAVIDGLRVDEEEVAAAVTYLDDQGLVEVQVTKASGHPYSIRLTAPGQECIEEHDCDMAAYLNRRSTPHVNVEGSGNALSFANGAGSSATASATSLDAAAIERFVSVFQEALSTLKVDDDSRAAAVKELAVLVDPGSDPSVKRKAGRMLGRIAEGSAGSGLWTAIAALASQIFG